MPKKDDKADEAPKRKPRTDPQGHPHDGPDFVPTVDDYDPDKHANRSHLNP